MPNPEVVKYIRDNWIPVAKMWANIGRRFFHEDQVRTVLNVACYETYLQFNIANLCSRGRVELSLINSHNKQFAFQETSNLVERFFLAVKYHYLCGTVNRRVETLLKLLSTEIEGTCR